MINSYDKEKLLELVHNPADAAAEHLEWATKLKNAPGVGFGIPAIDDDIISFHPGDMVVFVARPGHCKTSTLAYLARKEAMNIAETKAKDDIVIYISWEQITEEIDSYFHINQNYTATDIVKGDVDLDVVASNVYKRAELPVWLIGDSLSRTSTKSLRLTTDVIWATVEAIIDEYGKTPRLICGDYLQLVPIQRSKDLVSDITHAAGLLKELAKRCKCPLALGVQARQEVDDYKIKLPRSRDGQWASRIYQACDKWFSLWRPWITDKGAKPLKFNDQEYEITENLLIIKKLKERFWKPTQTWAMYFEPQALKLSLMESEAINPNYY
jgi:replicative DNA helicase